MYKIPHMPKTTLKINKSVEGETIETKVERIINNKEPIKDGAPMIYTERKDGVKKAYNIRTDRWIEAVDAMDKVEKSYKARREDKPSQIAKDESIQGKSGTDTSEAK